MFSLEKCSLACLMCFLCPKQVHRLFNSLTPQSACFSSCVSLAENLCLVWNWDCLGASLHGWHNCFSLFFQYECDRPIFSLRNTVHISWRTTRYETDILKGGVLLFWNSQRLLLRCPMSFASNCESARRVTRFWLTHPIPIVALSTWNPLIFITNSQPICSALTPAPHTISIKDKVNLSNYNMLVNLQAHI